LPVAEIAAVLALHPGAELVWCEEEPENMGYFGHLQRRLEASSGRPIRRAGRMAVATPAVGVKYWHEAEAKAVIAEAFA
jgi:2-oxoglutarate dehydrogenase E1 component